MTHTPVLAAVATVPFDRPSARATALAVYRQVLLTRVQRQRHEVLDRAQALGHALQPAALWHEAMEHARAHPTRWLAAGAAGWAGWAVWRSGLGRWVAPALGLWRWWRRLKPAPSPR